MEISDDKFMEIVMDTNTKVSTMSFRIGDIDHKLTSHCVESMKRHESHDERLKRLEKEAQLEPLNKDFKYWTKRLAPYTLGLSMLGYVVYDVYMKIMKG